MIPIGEAIDKLENYVSKHGDKHASVDEINKILGVKPMNCPKCNSRNVMVDEGYDENNPDAPTRCHDCNYIDLKKGF